MDDRGREIQELLDHSSRIRGQFVSVELQSCLTALDVAHQELAAGGVDIAMRESANIDRGIRAIRRFASEVPAEQQEGIAQKLAGLEEKLAGLKALIDARIREFPAGAGSS